MTNYTVAFILLCVIVVVPLAYAIIARLKHWQ